MPDLFIPKLTSSKEAVTQPQTAPVVTSSYEKPEPAERVATEAPIELLTEHTPHKHAALHNHPFAAFCDHPANVWFETQEPDELILLLLRKHIVTNIPWIAASVILVLVPPLLMWMMAAQTIKFDMVSFLPTQYIIILFCLYYLVVAGFILVSFITWFYTISMVTQKKVVDIDYSDVIYHNVATTKLTLIQDVDYTQTGAIRAVFNYGDVFVQTASKTPNFDFLAVPYPNEVTNTIESMIGKPPSAE